ncbi:hypothetical protein DFJ43DRAFT_291867 [Lentinula guzmanii]|uniref:Uncharacterized protein n=1 Tax=Lentinula guzmanii TaxID=2804957 RepID=A0AA38JAV5_9AGAR|nr:hypothetical protein DFJ43DRAFT_291867 [Lentinula guzmanii]
MFVQKPWIFAFSVAFISILLASCYTWSNDSISIITRILHVVSPSFSPIIKSQTSLTTSPLTPSINCTSPPPHTCTFYSACLETHFHCGPEGYPLGFGEKFCTKFSSPENVGRLSRKGEEWMWTTMGCLQRALVPELDIHKVSKTGPDSGIRMENACKALEEKAFSTHAPCYLSSGLCSLPPKDWVVIVEIIDVKTLLSSWDGFAGGVEAGEGCLEFFTRTLENSLHYD